MKSTVTKALLICTCLFSINSYAIKIGPPITTTITINQTSSGINASIPNNKQIKLMNIKLSTSEKQALFNNTPKIENYINTASTLPSSINLGMNGVPVLDQGAHGTCVTFATTAALDAIIGKGDYISPLCSLELGSWLAKDGYLDSGWDGSVGPYVIDQYLRFGVVSKDTEKSHSCAGISEYPLNDENSNGVPMSPDEYKSISIDESNAWYPIYLMSWDERVSSSLAYDSKTMEDTIRNVKQYLSKGQRVTLGTFLAIDANCNFAGACASYHTQNDTWALSSEITANNEYAGHEMVIIGYDDNAIATDRNGKKHRGLFILRNSWSEAAGDHGNFYMTYDYFRTFSAELQVIVAAKQI